MHWDTNHRSPITGSGSQRSHGPKPGHALTFKLDHSKGVGQYFGIVTGDAVIAIDLDYEEIGVDSSTMLMVSANGTAIRLG